MLDDFRCLELVHHGRKEIIRSRWHQDKGHRAELQAFAEAVINGRAAPIPFEEIIATTLTTLRIKDCLVSGEEMCVDVTAFMRSTLNPQSAGSVPA
jgi:hypothetical protein